MIRMRKQRGQSGEKKPNLNRFGFSRLFSAFYFASRNAGIGGPSVLESFRVFSVFRGEYSFLRSLCSFAANFPVRVYRCESVVRTTV
jgi:hypothetical protein